MQDTIDRVNTTLRKPVIMATRFAVTIMHDRKMGHPTTLNAGSNKKL